MCWMCVTLTLVANAEHKWHNMRGMKLPCEVDLATFEVAPLSAVLVLISVLHPDVSLSAPLACRPSMPQRPPHGNRFDATHSLSPSFSPMKVFVTIPSLPPPSGIGLPHQFGELPIYPAYLTFNLQRSRASPSLPFSLSNESLCHNTISVAPFRNRASAPTWRAPYLSRPPYFQSPTEQDFALSPSLPSSMHNELLSLASRDPSKPFFFPGLPSILRAAREKNELRPFPWPLPFQTPAFPFL